MFDFSIINEYENEFGTDFVIEMIDTLFQSVPNYFQQLHQLIETNDNSTFSRTAHSLKSNAKTFGALELAELCYTLEKESKTGSLSNLTHTLNQAEKEYQFFEKYMQHYKKEKLKN